MKRIYILIFTIFSTLSIFSQQIEAELQYLKAVKVQESGLIKDNIRNAMMSFDSILVHYPDVAAHSAEFIEELGNSFYQTKAYDKALFLYIVEASLFPARLPYSSRIHQLDKVYTLLRIGDDDIRRLNSISQLNPGSLAEQRLKAPLLIIKYLNTKGLDEVIQNYIGNLRQRGIIMPKEVQLWEDLVHFKVRRKIRRRYFTSNFANLSPELKRKYYRKASIYYRKMKNKDLARTNNENFKALSSSVFQLIDYRLRSFCIYFLKDRRLH